MREITTLPQTIRMSGWNGILPERKKAKSLEGIHYYDWVIIGAGYAGAAAARNLAQANRNHKIALIEAFEVGENASGKNAGFAIDLPHYAGKSEIESDRAKSEIKLYRYGIELLDTVIKEQGIQCDWAKSGRYHAAVSPEVGGDILKLYKESLEDWGEEFEYLERKELHERLGTEYYSSAVYTPGTYLLNPAALIRGLVDTLPDNVTVFEDSPVIEIDFESPKKYIRTPKGKINFGKAIVTVNGFLQKWGYFKNKQIPIVLYASLTKPLTQANISKLGNKPSWGITPAHNTGGCTVRYTQDNRILMRHGFNLSPSLNEGVDKLVTKKSKHEELIRKRFPEIDFEIDHSWMGWLSISGNNAPLFGKINDEVYIAACCNGTGVVRHTVAGTLISDLALNQQNPFKDIYLINGTASTIPPRPLLDIGFNLKLWLDRNNIRKEE